MFSFTVLVHFLFTHFFFLNFSWNMANRLWVSQTARMRMIFIVSESACGAHAKVINFRLIFKWLFLHKEQAIVRIAKLVIFCFLWLTKNATWWWFGSSRLLGSLPLHNCMCMKCHVYFNIAHCARLLLRDCTMAQQVALCICGVCMVSPCGPGFLADYPDSFHCTETCNLN